MHASQRIWCLSQDKVKWEGCGRKGIRRKKWGEDDGGGSLISLDKVAPVPMAGESASFIVPCTIKAEKKIFFGHGLSRVVPKKGCKMIVCVCDKWSK